MSPNLKHNLLSLESEVEAANQPPRDTTTDRQSGVEINWSEEREKSKGSSKWTEERRPRSEWADLHLLKKMPAWRHLRGRPYKTSAKCSGFWTPSPIVRIWDWFTVLNSRNLPNYIFFWANPPPPLSADVIYGCPLMCLVMKHSLFPIHILINIYGLFHRDLN